MYLIIHENKDKKLTLDIKSYRRKDDIFCIINLADSGDPAEFNADSNEWESIEWASPVATRSS